MGPEAFELRERLGALMGLDGDRWGTGGDGEGKPADWVSGVDGGGRFRKEENVYSALTRSLRRSRNVRSEEIVDMECTVYKCRVGPGARSDPLCLM